MLQNEDHHGESDLDKRIACLVRRHGDEWVGAIELQEPSPQFHQDVRKAILSCIASLGAGNSSRNSEIRKELEHVSRAATAAAKRLWRLHCAILALPPQRREQRDDWNRIKAGKLDLHLIPNRAQWVTVIGSRSWAMAQVTDKGGRSAMIGFQELIEGLLLAFKRATGRDGKVTLHPAQRERDGYYGGRFLRLVEAVLPLVRDVTEHLGEPLEFPTSPQARAKYIYEMTRKGSKKKRAPRAIPKTSNREP
jgi:hypothetical protein